MVHPLPAALGQCGTGAWLPALPGTVWEAASSCGGRPGSILPPPAPASGWVRGGRREEEEEEAPLAGFAHNALRAEAAAAAAVPDISSSLRSVAPPYLAGFLRGLPWLPRATTGLPVHGAGACNPPSNAPSLLRAFEEKLGLVCLDCKTPNLTSQHVRIVCTYLLLSGVVADRI